MVFQKAPNNNSLEEIAKICLNAAANNILMIQGVISIEIIYLWDTESGGSGGGGSGGQPDPDPEPDKEEEKCGHEICKGCNKPIRSNTRATLNCSHTEDEYCKSSGPVCDCGERHCDDNEIPKCSTIEKK